MIDEIQENPNQILQPGADGDEQRRRSRRRGRRGKSRTGSAPGAEPQPEQVVAPVPISVPQPPLHHHHVEPPRPTEHLRPGRSVYRDGIDRQVCAARESLYPMEWPINYRVGIAVRKLIEVGRTEESILFCNLTHPGPCVWPENLGLEPAQMVPAPAVIEFEAEHRVDEPAIESFEELPDSPEFDEIEPDEAHVQD